MPAKGTVQIIPLCTVFSVTFFLSILYYVGYTCTRITCAYCVSKVFGDIDIYRQIESLILVSASVCRNMIKINI